jgi:erythromycin esterase
MHLLRRATQIGITATIALVCAPTSAHSQALTDSGFARLIQPYIVRLAAPGASTCHDLERLRPVLAQARVVALGELIHDAHELHLLRNRFVSCLTSHLHFTGVALESGFADMAPLHDALLHPPRSVADLTRSDISYGWGGIPEVQALTETLRSHNARQPSGHRVSLYGLDLTGADGAGRLSRARRSIDGLTTDIATFDAAGARHLRMRFAPLLPRFSEAGYPAMTPLARDSLRALLDSAQHLAGPVSGSSSSQCDLATRCRALRHIAAARQSMAYFELLEGLGPKPRGNPDFWRLLQMRESIMADNLLWALEQEGPRGRILLLAHNAHVFAEPALATLHPPLAQQPLTLGQRLRDALGDAYVVIGTEARALGYYVNEQGAPDSASFGAVLRQVGLSWFIVDLRTAKSEPSLTAWLRQPRSIRFQWGYQRIRPSVAADLVIYADSLSPTGGELP